MDIDAAAERVYERIESYMKESDNTELTEGKQKEIFIGLLKVVMEEIAKIAVANALLRIANRRDKE